LINRLTGRENTTNNCLN